MLSQDENAIPPPDFTVRLLKPSPFIKLVKVEDENLKKDMKEAEDLLMSSLGINLPNFTGS